MSSRTLKRIALAVITFTLAIIASSSSSSYRTTASGLNTAPGSVFQYTSFSGATYQLRAFEGRYIRYALPDSWTGANGLSQDEINQLVDITDMTYAHLSEIMQGEPQGAGLLTIAVVDVGSQNGLGLIGSKGVEISPSQLVSVRRSLRAGLLPETVHHEVAHNFDLFNRYLGYYDDWKHAWTTFLIPYTQLYMQTGSLEFSAGDILNAKSSEYTFNWDKAGAGAGWAACVRDQGCAGGIRANEAWAGFMLRFARLHGQHAMIRALSYLKSYRDTHPNPPQTPEEKNDLLIKALAYGAGTNISCEIDAWRWSMTEAARSELAANYPPDPLCRDTDGDTYSAVTGDLNDQDKSVYPGATETINGLDDDCDSIIDDLLLKETVDLPSQPGASSTQASIPVRIKGYAEQQGQDSVIINVTSPGELKLKLRNRGEFHGWITLTSGDGLATSQSFYTLSIPEATFVVDRPGQWVITLTPDAGLTAQDPGGAGNYDLTVEPRSPESARAVLNVTQGTTPGTLRAEAAINPSVLSDGRTTHIRFWTSTDGFSSPRPLAQTVTFDWTPSTQNLPLALRAELLVGGVPSYRPTAPLWVNSSTGARVDFNTELALVARSLPAIMNYDQVMTLGFEVINNGPATADNVNVQVALDPAMKIEASQTTRGQIQMAAPNLTTLAIGRLAESERAIFNITVSALSARGDVTSTLRVVSSTGELDQTNNAYSVLIKVSGPTPTPSPTPQPTPEAHKVRPMPLRLENSQAAKTSVAGGISRVYVPLPNLSLAPLFSASDPTGNWPDQLGGMAVIIGGLPAKVISVTPAPEASLMSSSYAVDFAIPENVPRGAQIPLTVIYQPGNLTWSTTTGIQDSAPSLWAAGGMAVGDALAMESDTLVQITQSRPAVANNQNVVILYATGIRKLASSGLLRVRAITPGGQEIILPIDYAGPQLRLPGLDQINVKLPESLAGSGRVTIRIEGSSYSEVYLPVR